MAEIQEMRRRLNAARDLKKSLEIQLADYRSRFLQAQDFLTSVEISSKVLQEAALEIQQEAHRRIASVVSRCLEDVFEDAYQFEIRFERKRGRTEAGLVFSRRGLELLDPLNEAGGGVVDVAAFALRLVCLVLEKPEKRRLLILDEPFSKVRGSTNRSRVRALVENLADEFGVQFVINIDGEVYPEFLLGTVVEIENGKSS
jgi:hypothetical protein